MIQALIPLLSLECANHPEAAAGGTCTICRKPVCRDCSVRLEGSVVCNTDDHQSIARSWATIRSTDSEFEADILSKNLGHHGVETVVFSSRAFKLTIGKGPEDVVRVFVRKDSLGRAQEVLQSLGLEDGEQSKHRSEGEGPSLV